MIDEDIKKSKELSAKILKLCEGNSVLTIVNALRVSTSFIIAKSKIESNLEYLDNFINHLKKDIEFLYNKMKESEND